MHNLLRHLSKELGITMVIVTHDLNIAYKFADTVVCLNQKLFCWGPPNEILNSSQLENLYGGGKEFIHFHHHE